MGTYGGNEAGYTYITFLHEIDPTDSLTFVSGKLAEISILCYATNNYSISSKIAS